jgi:hypothetical protein
MLKDQSEADNNLRNDSTPKLDGNELKISATLV